MTVDVGENVTLPCVARGFPLPTVTWRLKDGRAIISKAYSSGGTVQLETGHLLIQGESYVPFPLFFFTLLHYPAIPVMSSLPKQQAPKRPQPSIGTKWVTGMADILWVHKHRRGGAPQVRINLALQNE